MATTREVDCVESVPEKACPKCGSTKALTAEFWGKDKQQKDGMTRLCRLCTNAYCRAYNQTWRSRQPEKVKQYAAISAERVKARRATDPEYHARQKALNRANCAKRRDKNPEKFREMARYYREITPKEVLSARVRASVRKAACREFGVATYEEVQAIRAQQRQDRRADDLALRAYKAERVKAATAEVAALLDAYAAPLIAAYERERKLEERRQYRARLKAERPEKYAAMNRATRQRRRARERNAVGSFTHDDLQKQFRLQNGKCYYCAAALKTTGGHQERYHADHFLPLALGGSNNPDNIVLACPACNSNKSGLPPEEYLNSIGRLL